MTEDTQPPSLSHLLSERTRLGGDGPGVADWRDRITAETVDLTYGFPFPDAFPTEELRSATETLFEDEPERALQYGGGEYADALPGSIAERCRSRGIGTTAEEVLVTNGATNAIDVVCRTFLDPGDLVVVEAPTFTWSLGVIRSHGVETLGVPVDDEGMDVEGMDVEALATALARRRREGLALPTLCYTIPTFQNPTGVTLSRPRRQRLLELAAEYDFVVLEDDAYGELRYDGDAVPTLRELDSEGRVIHVGTVSKTIAPGVRTGWAVADEALVDHLGAMRTGGPNRFTMGVVSAYWLSGHLETAVPDLRRAYERRRDHTLQALDRYLPAVADWTQPDGGFFVWVELPTGIDTGAMLPTAIDRGVAYLPGAGFYDDDGQLVGNGGEPVERDVDGAGAHSLRLSFSRASPEAIDRGVEALGRTVRDHLAR